MNWVELFVTRMVLGLLALAALLLLIGIVGALAVVAFAHHWVAFLYIIPLAYFLGWNAERQKP